MTLVVAHRGSAQEAPQNSVSAFLDARRRGADGVELDIRRSRDGAIVVNHDPGIEGLGAICEISVADLPDHVALLSEAGAASTGMLLNVEIKNSPAEPGYDPSDSLVSQVLEELSELNHADGTIISSFDLGTLEAVRRLDPTMATGLLIEVGAAGVGSVEVAAERGISAIHPFFFDTNAELVAAAREFGIEVNVWTVNARHDIEAMAALGLDAIITDDVTLARSVIDGD